MHIHHLRIEEDLANRIDEWRSRKRPIPTFNTALKVLAVKGLEAEYVAEK